MMWSGFWFDTVKSNEQGFTLMELLTVIAIILTVTAAMTLSPQSRGGSQVRNVAEDIVVNLREIQVNAVSVRNDGSGGFDHGLGLHIQGTNAGNGAVQYQLFYDNDVDGEFDGSDTVFQTVTLPDGLYFVYACEAIDASGDCASNGNKRARLYQNSGRFIVAFARPEFGAQLNRNNSNPNQTWTEAYLQLRNVAGASEIIHITDDGLIEVLPD